MIMIIFMMVIIIIILISMIFLLFTAQIIVANQNTHLVGVYDYDEDYDYFHDGDHCYHIDFYDISFIYCTYHCGQSKHSPGENL